MRYTRAHIDSPPKSFFLQWGDLPQSLEEWVQPAATWRMILYGHEGVARMNGRAYTYSKETGLIFPPDANCGHAKVGPPSLVVNAFFDFPESHVKPLALPVQFELNPGWFEMLWDAGEHAIEGAVKGKALVWHILWTIAKPTSVMRDQSAIYEAEDMIRADLGGRIVVSELAKALDVSQATLLMWFQAEHGTTIQGFIRQTRAREACRLLVNSSLTIKAIAARVGIPDLHQFNKLVRSHTGLSPREYRVRAG